MDEQTIHTGDTVTQDPVLEQEARRFAPVSTGAFFGYKLLYGIPVIGWILCAVFSFTEKNVNKRNFARATLIGLIISLVITCVIGFAVVKVAEFVIEQVVTVALGGSLEELGSVMDAAEELQAGKHDGLIRRIEDGEFGDHPELIDLLDELRDGGKMAVIGQFQNGGFDDVRKQYADGAYDDLIERAVGGDLGDLGALGKVLETLPDREALDLSGDPAQ